MILGSSTFGSGILGSDAEMTVFGMTAVADDSTASVALTVSGLDFAQYITIQRANLLTDEFNVVRGANQVATYSGPGYELGVNLLGSEDSGFETGTGSWAAGTNCASIAQSASFAYTGFNSLAVTSSAAGIVVVDKGNSYSSQVAVVPGETYQFSYWVYTANSTRMANIEVNYYLQPANNLMETDSFTTQGVAYTNLVANGWTQVSITTTAPAGCNFADIQCQPIAQGTAEIFYIDNAFYGEYSFTGFPSSTFTVTDYECPLNTPVTYIAEMGILVDGVPTLVLGAFSNTVELSAESGTAWIKNVLAPGLNQLVTISSMSDAVSAARTQSTYVIGRKNPIVLVDAMGGRSGTITFLTQSLADKETLLATLASPQSQSLFLQTAAVDGFNDMYFSINTSVTENRPAGVSYDPTRLVPVTYIEVDSPSDAVTAISENDWLDVLNGWSSWQDMLSQRPTWLTVLTAPFGTYPGDSA
jgi:Carbohydrate binding domain